MEEVENMIIKQIESKYAKLVKDTIGEYTGEDGKFSANGLWKQTRKIFPTKKTRSSPHGIGRQQGKSFERT